MVSAESVLRRFLATQEITEQHIERWAKDLRLMTKIYKSIENNNSSKNTEIAEEARTLFLNFRNRFESWVYKVVLPPNASDDSLFQKELRKEAWTALYTLEIGQLFPRFGSNAKAYDLSSLVHERDKIIRKYQASFNKVFKVLKELVDAKGGSLESSGDEAFTVEIAGMAVTVMEGAYSEETVKDRDMALRELGSYARGVIKAGFSKAVQGLVIEIAPHGSSKGLKLGQYNSNTDVIQFTPLGLASDIEGTFTHEVGHRFWYREMTPQARSYWNEVMESRGVTITDTHVNNFFHAVDQKGYTTDDVEVLSRALPKAKDELEEKIFEQLAKIPMAPWGSTYNPDRYLDMLEKSVGENVLIEEISDYGATSAIEAFAECFRLYVLKGPRSLGPATQDLFRRVVSSGGVRLARQSPRSI